MNEEKLNQILPQMFQQVKVPKNAKENLRTQLFGKYELPDDDLELVSAAGDLIEMEQEKKSDLPKGAKEYEES